MLDGSVIFDKICIALNANDVDSIPILVESAFDCGYTEQEIKEAVKKCIVRPNFDVIYEFCRAMHYEKVRRIKRG